MSGVRNAPSGEAPTEPSARVTDGAPVEPITTSPPAASSFATCASTSSRCAVEASGPIVTPSARGSPTTTRSSIRARTAATRASTDAAGTIARRIAVHFCPAFEVISVTSWRTYASNSGVSGTASGPRIEALIESVSLVNRTPPVCTLSWARSFSAVDALPVKPTMSPRRR